MTNDFCRVHALRRSRVGSHAQRGPHTADRHDQDGDHLASAVLPLYVRMHGMFTTGTAGDTSLLLELLAAKGYAVVPIGTGITPEVARSVRRD